MLLGMGSNKTFLFIACGNANGTDTLKDSLSVSYKTKYTSTMWFSNHTPWCLLQRSSKFVSIQKTTHGCYSIFIHNSQNLEGTKVSFTRKMDKLTMAHPDNGILYSIKKTKGYQVIRIHGGKLNAYYQMKETIFVLDTYERYKKQVRNPALRA